MLDPDSSTGSATLPGKYVNKQTVTEKTLDVVTTVSCKKNYLH
jgi:hypothetical protein